MHGQFTTFASTDSGLQQQQVTVQFEDDYATLKIDDVVLPRKLRYSLNCNKVPLLKEKDVLDLLLFIGQREPSVLALTAHGVKIVPKLGSHIRHTYSPDDDFSDIDSL